MMKRFLPLIAALLILSLLPVNGFAHDYVQPDREGSITLELKYDGEYLTGGKFSCTKVAEVTEEDGNFYFRTLAENKIYRDGIPELEHVLNLVENNGDVFQNEKLTLANESGTVVFEGRMPGLYLIAQEEAMDGYSLINSFLVSIPYMEDGVYVYDVTARSKAALEPDEIGTEPEEEDPDDDPDEDEDLPQTGQLNWPVPVMVACGLGAFTFGWYLRFGKKKESYEE